MLIKNWTVALAGIQSSSREARARTFVLYSVTQLVTNCSFIFVLDV